MKLKSIYIDKFLLIIVIILSLIGLINFFSASSYYSFVKNGNSFKYFFDFFLKTTVLGFFAFFVGNFLGNNFQKSKPLFLILFIISYISLYLVFLQPFSVQVGEARRWVKIGPINFQPAEILKPFALLIFIFFLSSNPLSSFKAKLVFIFIFFLIIALPIFKQPAMTNLLIILSSLIFASFIFLKNIREYLKVIIFFGILGLIFVIVGSFLWSYRIERIKAFFTGGKVHEEKIFQLKQTTIAISSGGLLGKGLGKSQMKLLDIPRLLDDSIFAIFAEEWGFVGSVFLLSLFLLLIFRIITLAHQTNNLEKKAFALGVAAWIFLQTFIHIISNIGLFVPTGVVLPFFSWGASSQIAIYFSLGLISSFKT
mgnify:CR=1 FL=1